MGYVRRFAASQARATHREQRRRVRPVRHGAGRRVVGAREERHLHRRPRERHLVDEAALLARRLGVARERRVAQVPHDAAALGEGEAREVVARVPDDRAAHATVDALRRVAQRSGGRGRGCGVGEGLWRLRLHSRRRISGGHRLVAHCCRAR